MSLASRENEIKYIQGQAQRRASYAAPVGPLSENGRGDARCDHDGHIKVEVIAHSWKRHTHREGVLQMYKHATSLAHVRHEGTYVALYRLR